MYDQDEMFVKVCGVTNEEDALCSVGMGADAIGFNFVAGSSRRISPKDARDISKRLPGGIVTVGVFRNTPPEEVIQIMDTAGLRIAQLHGNESAKECQWIAERVPRLIKAFSAGNPEATRAHEYGASVLLLDGPEPGSGKVFDWSMMVDRDTSLPLILAGGLNARNVATAIETVQPWAVDVASGVESTPGRKDVLKVREFVNAAKQAGARLHASKEYAASGATPFNWRDDG